MRLLVREVIEEACRATALGVASAHSPAYDHRANGAVERAIREVKDQVRVLYSALAAKVGSVPLDCPAFDWLVEWAAEALTGAQVGVDGTTAYRRLRGRNWEPRIAAFGEMILARRSRALDQAALAVRWDRVVYLGTRWGTAEHFVGDSDGSVRMVRTIRRISKDRRWDAAAI